MINLRHDTVMILMIQAMILVIYYTMIQVMIHAMIQAMIQAMILMIHAMIQAMIFMIHNMIQIMILMIYAMIQVMILMTHAMTQAMDTCHDTYHYTILVPSHCDLFQRTREIGVTGDEATTIHAMMQIMIQFLTPHACARGMSVVVVVVVGTKIARSRVLGICARCKHTQSVDIGEKLVYMGFKLLKKAY